MIIIFFLLWMLSCNKLVRYPMYAVQQAPERTLEDLARLVSSLPIVPNPLCAIGRDGRNIIHHCVLNNKPERMQLCLSLQFIHVRAPDFNQQDIEGCTPLHLAAENGYTQIVNLLLKKEGIEVNLLDFFFGRTPLHFAAGNGHVDVVKALLQNCKVELNIRDGLCDSAIDLATENGHLALVKALLQDPNKQVHIVNNYGRTILHLAADYCHLPLVQFLVNEVGVPINARDKDGSTALHLAVENGYLDIVESLLSCSDIDLNISNFCKKTALEIALDNGHVAIVKRLLQTGEGPSACNIPLVAVPRKGGKRG